MPITIRDATPDDAAAIVNHVLTLIDEPDSNVPLSTGEWNVSEEEERRVLKEFAASDNSLFLVAEADGQIVGELNCKGFARRALRHVTVMGMSVKKECRGQGVGDLLMQRMVEWAKNSNVIRRVELYVFSTNSRAIHLYEKHGFVIEGTRRGFVRRGDEFLDDHIMALWIEKT